jgi:hypothetical protein
MNTKNVRQEWGANVNAAITASEAAASWEPSVARERPAPADREGCRAGEGVRRRWRVPSRTQSWSGFYTQHPGKAYDWSGFEIIHFLQKIGIWSGKNHASAIFDPNLVRIGDETSPPIIGGPAGIQLQVQRRGGGHTDAPGPRIDSRS